jgi:hypothetical protein
MILKMMSNNHDIMRLKRQEEGWRVARKARVLDTRSILEPIEYSTRQP